MSLEDDPVTDLRHYPMPMGKYGKNPYGENLYRIVFASSRRRLIGGRWHVPCARCDGTGEEEPYVRCDSCGGLGNSGYEDAYHWAPAYPDAVANRSPWILERWYTGMEFAGMSQIQWDLNMIDPVSGWLILGPYPSRGEYDLAFEFGPTLLIGSSDVDRIVGATERGRLRSYQDVHDFHSAEYAAQEKSTKAMVYDDFRNDRPAFGQAPISALTGVSRGTKTVLPMRSAEELGLPTPKMGGRPTDLNGLQYRSSFSRGDLCHA